jgi:hypothetical protein
MKKRSMGRRGLAADGIVGGAVDQVDVEPAVVVVIDQADARAIGFEDVLFLGRAHDMTPAGEPCSRGCVSEDHGALVDKSTGRDRPLVFVINRIENPSGSDASHSS